jgi:very-short-patch-repair endonuclease
MAYLGKTIKFASYYDANENLCDFAKVLRKKMTKSEKILWQVLRRKNIRGVKFRRQHPIEYYVADFYCHEARLVVEVDGPIHKRKDRIEHDLNRTAELDRLGIKVIRFTNEQVKTQLNNVMKTIREEIIKRLDQKENRKNL